ncbi:FliM/FliN family flagellar motor switch protein [Paraburkholderia sediminicola]|uniref:FliM/FliN family flagellar motor switch protein n=1 Tax=Paraburkholderia sediminicola TaxID=458836 RepID=UPI0038BDE623
MLVDDVDPDTVELFSTIGGGVAQLDAYELAEVGPVFLGVVAGLRGGNGLMLEALIGGERFALWFDEHQWCQWVAPLLPVPALQEVPKDFTGPLAAWTLEPLAAFAEQQGLGNMQAVKMGRERVESASAPVICFESQASRLDARVVAAPRGWLKRLAGSMDRLERDPIISTIDVALCIGWVRIDMKELESLNRDCCVVLDCHTEVEKGEFLLCEQGLLATAILDESKSFWTISAISDECEQRMRGDAHGAASSWSLSYGVSGVGKRSDQGFTHTGEDKMGLNITVMMTAEVARIPVDLETLKSLHPGMLIETAVLFSNQVKLCINGQQVATGQLVRLGERLGVRVE